MSRISVLIPLYNKEEYIVKALESVREQLLPSSEWEIVIVDDGSTDKSYEAVLGYCREHPELMIQVIAFPSNLGCAAATDTAARAASYPLCTILDGDDILDTKSLTTITQFFRAREEVVYAWTRYRILNPSGVIGKEGRSKALPRYQTLKTALLRGWWGALAQRSFRTEAYLRTGGLNHGIPYVVDQQLASLFAKLGEPVEHIPIVTYYHTQDKNQMSRLHYKDQQQCRRIVLEGLGGRYVHEL